MRVELYPPISLIRNGLFGEELPIERETTRSDPAVQENNFEMPAFLADMVSRRVASQAAFPPEDLAAGQIRHLARIPKVDGKGRSLGRSFGVLLGACLGGQCWSGWMVAQEADYATDRDLVLQTEDGPFSPEAAMVQAWNPVRIWLRGDEAILGKLAPRYLGAVSSLAENRVNAGAFVPSRPGRIGAWNLNDGTTVVTGTPLGDQADPRREYQKLYGDLAVEICAAAVTQPQFRTEPAGPGLFDWLQHIFVRPAWTFGAIALVLAQGLWIMLSSTLPPDETAVYRSAAHIQKADPCSSRIRIIFKPETPYAEVVVLLRRIDAIVADGPSETGEVWVTLPNDQKRQEAAGVLKLSPLVEAADVIPADKGSCAK